MNIRGCERFGAFRLSQKRTTASGSNGGAVRPLCQVRECFAGASHLLAAGSTIRDDGNAHSDIDLIEVFHIEAFVHAPETLAYVYKKDARGGVPIIVDRIPKAFGGTQCQPCVILSAI